MSVTVPIVISAIALAVAGLSYQDQHDSGIAAATAEQESEANLVTAYEQDNGVFSNIIVQNLGNAPVYHVYVHADVVVDVSPAPSSKQKGVVYGTAVGKPFIFAVDTLPACSTSNISLNTNDTGMGTLEDFFVESGLATQKDTYLVNPNTLTFTDTNQNSWSRSFDTGILQKIDPSYAHSGPGSIDILQINNAATSNDCK